jgi:hypothetical protein
MKRAVLIILACTTVLAAAVLGSLGSAGSGKTALRTVKPAALGAGNGTSGVALPPVALGGIPPFMVFPNADYQTGGTGWRNQRKGGITLNGIPAGAVILKAYLYWAVITTGAPGAKQAALTAVKRSWPNPPNVVFGPPVPGVLVASSPAGGQPCWGGAGDVISVYRSDMTASGVVNGNGFYQVAMQLNPGTSSSQAGEDPWAVALGTPLWEGASIVAIYQAPTGTVSLYDAPLAATTWGGAGGLGYVLPLPAPTPPGVTLTKWDSIAADGQHGTSRTAMGPVSDETTVINGIPVAGPGSPYNDSDFNGGDSTPLPSLWDTTGHAINFAPGTPALMVANASASAGLPTDCITGVANVVRSFP